MRVPGHRDKRPEDPVVSRRREDRAERDEILCHLARQLPEKDRDSSRALAKWLLQLKDNRFSGLNALVTDQEVRDRFMAWVKLGSEDSIAKAAWRAYSARATRTTKLSPKASAPPSPPKLPPLLWPRGMRQRKDSDPKFKLPLLYGYPDGSERVFCECLGDKTLHEVTATLQGRSVGYWPAVRPGEFVELEWKADPQLVKVVTYNGNRDWILQYESFKDLSGAFSKDDNSPTAQALRPMSAFAARQVERIEKVLPSDLDTWKRKVWGYRLEIRYSIDDGAVSGKLTGTLLMTMEDLWFRFRDDKGHETLIR